MIAAEHVTLTLAERTILHDVSFSLQQNEALLLLGENGAGKSMLLKTLLGWFRYEGIVRIKNVDAKTMKAEDRARAVSFIGQDMHVDFSYSVYEIVEMGRFVIRGGVAPLIAEDRERIRDALAMMDVLHLADARVNEISTGERMRTFIARALATESEILLLDEPTASLDVRHRLSIFRVIDTLLAEGKSVVMSIHDINDALRLNRPTLLLHQGHVVAFGKGSDVLSEKNIRAVFGVTSEKGNALDFYLP